MQKFAASLAIAALASFARADYIIDPEDVSASDRAAWCQSQIASCPLICQQIDDGPTQVNDCDPDTLMYGCLCGNGQQPNVSEYTLTIPYFTCTEFGNQCVENCGNNNACANSCREDNPCGAQNPQQPNATSTDEPDSQASPTETDDDDGPVNTDVLGSDVGNDNAGSRVIGIGRSYGLAIVGGALFVGFAML